MIFRKELASNYEPPVASQDSSGDEKRELALSHQHFLSKAASVVWKSMSVEDKRPYIWEEKRLKHEANSPHIARSKRQAKSIVVQRDIDQEVCLLRTIS